MRMCLNTGEELHKVCNADCVHHSSRSRTGCIHHVYARPLTFVDIAHFDGVSAVEARRKMSRAEIKIIAWGKVLEGMHKLKPQPFESYMHTVARQAPDIAERIVSDFGVYVIAPMMYVKPDLWRPIIAAYAQDLQQAGMVPPVNSATWLDLEMCGLL